MAKHSWLLVVLLAACGSPRRVEPSANQVRSAPAQPATQPPRASGGLYAASEALADALSSPLQHLGTGKWPGIRRMFACAFRNQRVLVVNAYCGLTDRQAFRVDIYSPTRGRVRLYAESKGSVSTRRAEEYFTFMVESEPLSPAVQPPPLGVSFGDLRAYEQRRYDAFLPVCFAGRELSQPRNGCLGSLAPHANEWTRQNSTFLARASEDWYRLLRDQRTLATQYGKEPD